jgi:hypothetical protein
MTRQDKESMERSHKLFNADKNIYGTHKAEKENFMLEQTPMWIYKLGKSKKKYKTSDEIMLKIYNKLYEGKNKVHKEHSYNKPFLDEGTGTDLRRIYYPRHDYDLKDDSYLWEGDIYGSTKAFKKKGFRRRIGFYMDNEPEDEDNIGILDYFYKKDIEKDNNFFIANLDEIYFKLSTYRDFIGRIENFFLEDFIDFSFLYQLYIDSKKFKDPFSLLISDYLPINNTYQKNNFFSTITNLDDLTENNNTFAFLYKLFKTYRKHRFSNKKKRLKRFHRFIKPHIFGSWYQDVHPDHNNNFFIISGAKKRKTVHKGVFANELIDDNRLFYSLINISQNINLNEKFNNKFTENFSYSFTDINFIIPYVPLHNYSTTFFNKEYKTFFQKVVSNIFTLWPGKTQSYKLKNINIYNESFNKPFSLFENISYFNFTSKDALTKLEQKDIYSSKNFFLTNFSLQSPVNYFYAKNNLLLKQHKTLLSAFNFNNKFDYILSSKESDNIAIYQTSLLDYALTKDIAHNSFLGDAIFHKDNRNNKSIIDLLKVNKLFNKKDDVESLRNTFITALNTRNYFDSPHPQNWEIKKGRNLAYFFLNRESTSPGAKLWAQTWAPLTIFSPFRDFTNDSKIYHKSLSKVNFLDRKPKINESLIKRDFYSLDGITERFSEKTKLVFLDPLFTEDYTNLNTKISFEITSIFVLLGIMFSSFIYIFSLFRLHLLFLWLIKYLDERDFFLMRKVLGFNIYPYIKRIIILSEKVILFLIILGFLFFIIKFPFFFYLRWPVERVPEFFKKKFSYIPPTSAPLTMWGIKIRHNRRKFSFKRRYIKRRRHKRHLKKRIKFYKRKYYTKATRARPLKRKRTPHLSYDIFNRFFYKLKHSKLRLKRDPLNNSTNKKYLNIRKEMWLPRRAGYKLLLRMRIYSMPVFQWYNNDFLKHKDVSFKSLFHNLRSYNYRRTKRFKTFRKFKTFREFNSASNLRKTFWSRRKFYYRNFLARLGILPRDIYKNYFGYVTGPSRRRFKRARVFTKYKNFNNLQKQKTFSNEIKPSWGFKYTIWSLTKVVFLRIYSRIFLVYKNKYNYYPLLNNLTGFNYIFIKGISINNKSVHFTLNKSKHSLYQQALPIFPHYFITWFISALDVFLWHFFHIILIIFFALFVGYLSPTLQQMPSSYVINRLKYIKWLENVEEEELRKRGIFIRKRKKFLV